MRYRRCESDPRSDGPLTFILSPGGGEGRVGSHDCFFPR